MPNDNTRAEAIEFVTRWLDDDAEFRIPGSVWGDTLYDSLRDLLSLPPKEHQSPASHAVERIRSDLYYAVSKLTEARSERDQLRRQVEAVRALAEAWHHRGEHDMEFSKTLPEDVRDVIYEGGAEWVEFARKLSVALDGAEGGADHA